MSTPALAPAEPMLRASRAALVDQAAATARHAMQTLYRIAEREFHRILRSSSRIPQLHDVRACDCSERPGIEFVATFTDRTERHWFVDERDVNCGHADLIRLCHDLPQLYNEMAYRYHHERVEESAQYMRGLSYAQQIDAPPEDLRPGGITWVSPADINDSALANMAAMTIQQAQAMQAMQLAMAHQMYGQPQWSPEEIAVFRAEQAERVRKSQEAADRGMKLLRSWLDPKQSEQYAKEGHFDVIGSEGTRYRITNGVAGNVHEYDRHGKQTKSWCFQPVGCLCMGDTMLAQKIALETDEKAAIRVANRVGIGVGFIEMQIWPTEREGFFRRWFA